MSKTNGLGVVAAIVVGIAVVSAMGLLARAIVRTKGADEVIRVTGSARRPIRSDLIVWAGSLTYEAPTVAAAYSQIKLGTKKVESYLQSKGIKSDEIVTKAIQTRPLYEQLGKDQQSSSDSFRKVVAYELSQDISVRSSDVSLVQKVSREVTDLIATGINFTSNQPQYYYTKISDMKVEILAEAAKDARRRAEEIAKSSGATLGTVRYARMSPLQITTMDNMDISSEGQNDTSSLDKAITAIVQMGFSIN